MLGRQGLVGNVGHQQLCSRPSIPEAQGLAGPLRLDALAGQALGPEVEGSGRPDPPQDAMDHARAGTTGSGAGVLEEGQVEAGWACLSP